MEHDLIKLFCLLLQRNLEVLLPEEPRIAQARSEHPAIAFDDRSAAVVRLDVGGADERRRQRAIGIRASEILLVGAHGEHDHLARHIKVIGVEPAEQRHRPLGQSGVLRDEPCVFDQSQALGLSSLARTVPDDGRALVLVDNDPAGLELLHIVARAAKGDRTRMVEPMPGRGRTAGDAVHCDRHDLLAEQGHDTVQRADPAQGRRALRRRAPAHRLGPGEAADDPLDGRAEHRLRCLSSLVDHREQHAVALHQRIAGQPRLAQETLQRLWRGRSARALDLLGPCGGRQRQPPRDQRKPARRCKRLDRVGCEPRPIQLLREQPRQVVARLRLHSGGNFLG